MQIVTRAISITPVKLFWLAMRRHYENNKWMLYALILSFLSYSLLISIASTEFQYILGLIGYGIILTFFLIIPIFYWQQVNRMKDTGAFLPRTYHIDEEQIVARVEDGSQGVYPWEVIRRISQTASYYMLYISQAHFIYIEKKSFQSQDDHKQFTQWLTLKGLLEKPKQKKRL